MTDAEAFWLALALASGCTLFLAFLMWTPPEDYR
jgi:hypothetical protein